MGSVVVWLAPTPSAGVAGSLCFSASGGYANNSLAALTQTPRSAFRLQRAMLDSVESLATQPRSLLQTARCWRGGSLGE
jgi:hypothetical protein